MTNIVRAAIHPGIGIARVGNSDEYFLAPQVLAPLSKPEGFYHDESGALKREAVEFRIFGYDADDNVVAELKADNAVIKWEVHLKSTKAAWYKFVAAMDIDQAKDFEIERRNRGYEPGKRDDLVIDAGPVNIQGVDAGKNGDVICAGEFRYEDTKTNVLIGELKTDRKGRLHVLSGKGVSGSPLGLPLQDNTVNDWFANAKGWYDDIADGPLSATVSVDGSNIPCEGAWVATAPPNYAPDIIGWRTMDDLLQELYSDAGWIKLSEKVSFTRDIYPLLSRLNNLQWVNQGFAAMFGVGAPLDFTNPELIDRISRVHGKQDAYKELRRGFLNAFRPVGELSIRSWPWLFGDAFGTFSSSDPANHLPIWPLAEKRLKQWVDGNFVEDWQTFKQPQEIGDVDLEDRPTMLDRASLHFCLADAFHPGCELTWPMRHLSIYSAPYRIRRRDKSQPEPDFGLKLTRTDVFSIGGPLHAQGPGDLSRWMALPWQMDTAGCRSDYDRNAVYDPYLPSFWPARVPNQVLTEDAYRTLVDTTLSAEDRRDAFKSRRTWYFPLHGKGGDQMTAMVNLFGSMGVIERRPAPTDGALPELPEWIYVENIPPSLSGLMAAARFNLEDHPDEIPDNDEQKRAQLGGWESAEQRAFFTRARFPQLAESD